MRRSWHGRATFSAELWEYSPGDPGSWHFLTLPLELSEEIKFEAGPRHGFGSIRVDVCIGSTAWRTSLFPEAATGTFVLPVKEPVRRAEHLRAGTACDVRIQVGAPS